MEEQAKTPRRPHGRPSPMAGKKITHEVWAHHEDGRVTLAGRATSEELARKKWAQAIKRRQQRNGPRVTFEVRAL